MVASAKVIADSVSPAGDRLTTFEVVLWRPLLAEFNTHRWSRNGASSRAIPIDRQLARLDEEVAWPVSWPAEKPGMQGGTELEDRDLWSAQNLVSEIYRSTRTLIDEYLEVHPEKSKRLHKSYLARYLEPFMWQTMIFTTTEGQLLNFLQQRCSRFSLGAQAEFRAMADAVFEAYEASTPVLRTADPSLVSSWHLPYIQDDEWHLPLATLIMVSVARCCRVSYLNHDGVRALSDDLDLFKKLLTADPKHWSPTEHVAYPAEVGRVRRFVAKVFKLGTGTPGNLVGWNQGRHVPEVLELAA